jgi:glucose/mannose-6-phosphate isomerase
VGDAVTDLGPARVAELDASDMLGAIAGLGAQLTDGYAAAHRALADVAFVDGAAGPTPALPARPTGVAVLGMGGSAIGADLVLAASPSLDVPATVVRGYELPAWVGPEALVVAVSYSGDTEEALAATGSALDRGCTPLCVAGGGRLAALAAARGLPAVSPPPGLQPRAALGHLAMPVLAALERAGLVRAADRDVAEAAALLTAAAADYAACVADQYNPAKGVARRLCGRVALVYGAGLTAGAARRWKTQLNENAKMPAFFAELPELDHNEVEGWGAAGIAGAAHVVVLEDAAADERLGRRITATVEELGARGVSAERIATRGTSALARVFSLVTLGDHVSLYLALLEGVDPTPVDVIGRIKRRLAGAAEAT